MEGIKGVSYLVSRRLEWAALKLEARAVVKRRGQTARRASRAAAKVVGQERKTAGMWRRWRSGNGRPEFEIADRECP
jgi:hypothetical protein